MKFPKNPFKNLKLTPEEKEIEEAIEKGQTEEIKLTAKERKNLQDAAKSTLDKTRNINIRLSARDLHNLKVKAMEEGIPYQTLAGSIIHKYTAA